MKNVCIFLCLFSTSVYCQNDVAVSETSSRKSKTILSESADAIDPAAIDIVRDKFGVPHIFARTDREVAYGLAWAHSEDDFETIQKSFLASRAMLGQHLGKHGAIVDYVVHLLRLRELVNKRYAQDISPDFKEVLQGYCDGYNAYAESHPKEVLEKKAFPAIPQDILAYSVLQLALGTGVDDALKNIHNETTPLAQWKPSGSNAIAFNSAKTEDGAVYLTINTHHPLEGQVSWYEAHLSSAEGWNIVGALFPGAPVIFTGFNENLGWTHTVNHPDRLVDYNDVDLAGNYGQEKLFLIGPRIDLTFTDRLFLTTYFQYNNLLDNMNLNVRFQWRYKPASDLFVVYTENYFPQHFASKNRALVFKFTYWLNL